MLLRNLAVLAVVIAVAGCSSPYAGPGDVEPRAAVDGEKASAAEIEREAGAAVEGAVDEAAGAVEERAAGSEKKTVAETAEKAKQAFEGAAARGESKAAAASDSAIGVFQAKADDHAMWGRTPGRNMANPFEKGIASNWDIMSGKNIKWVAQLGSQSYGNPVISGGKIFVGTNNQAERNPKIKGDKGIMMCFNEADGKFLWQAVHDKLEAGRVNDWPEQGICSSPVVEDGKLYYVSNRAEVVCADVEGFLDGENDGPYKDEKYTDPIDGDFIWVLDMMEELGVFPHNLATCSPMIVGDLLFVITANGVERDHITIPSPRSPSFLAINKRTGAIAWENNDPGEAILHGQWSAPAYIEAGGRPQVIFPGGDGWVRSYEPKTGKLIWEFDCNPKDSKWELGGRGTRNSLISTPVCVDGVVYTGVGQDPEHGEGIGHLYAIDASKTGDITENGRVWHYGNKDFRRTISTVPVHVGLVYASDLSGFLHCLDQKTGKPYWVHDTLAAVWGSPTVIDGKVYMGDEDGDVVVLETGKERKVIFETNMDNSVYTTPVASKGVLYIATRTHLFAIEEKK